ncbi:MAG: hypothetical protein L0220_13275, partial [Acidobacteria bacterium]|nr:hypothetical protein [Acidobacteriota bacterium]
VSIRSANASRVDKQNREVPGKGKSGDSKNERKSERKEEVNILNLRFNICDFRLKDFFNDKS